MRPNSTMKQVGKCSVSAVIINNNKLYKYIKNQADRDQRYRRSTDIYSQINSMISKPLPLQLISVVETVAKGDFISLSEVPNSMKCHSSGNAF